MTHGYKMKNLLSLKFIGMNCTRSGFKQNSTGYFSSLSTEILLTNLIKWYPISFPF